MAYWVRATIDLYLGGVSILLGKELQKHKGEKKGVDTCSDCLILLCKLNNLPPPSPLDDKEDRVNEEIRERRRRLDEAEDHVRKYKT